MGKGLNPLPFKTKKYFNFYPAKPANSPNLRAHGPWIYQGPGPARWRPLGRTHNPQPLQQFKPKFWPFSSTFSSTHTLLFSLSFYFLTFFFFLFICFPFSASLTFPHTTTHFFLFFSFSPIFFLSLYFSPPLSLSLSPSFLPFLSHAAPLPYSYQLCTSQAPSDNLICINYRDLHFHDRHFNFGLRFFKRMRWNPFLLIFEISL